MSLPFADLKRSMIIPDGAKAKPRMKLKAAEGRHFLPIIRHVLIVAFARSTPREILRFQCVDAMFQCHEIMKNWGPGPKRELARQTRTHLLLYLKLFREVDDPICWQPYPKHHLMIHNAEDCECNPRFAWNYGCESAIGESSEMAQGLNVLYLSTSLIERYRVTYRLDV